MGVVVLRKARSRKRTLVGIAFLVFASAVLVVGLFAFLTNNHKYSQTAWETEADSAKINIVAADAAFTTDVKMTTGKVEDQEIIKLAKRTAGQNSNDVLAFNITFTDKTRTVSADATLAVQFYGDAVVHYYIENTTNELADEKTLHGLVGDIFSVEASEIDGYELLNADIAGEYNYSDDAQTIVFYYREILPPAPDNPNTSDGVKVIPIAGFGAIFVFGLSFIAKRRRSQCVKIIISYGWREEEKAAFAISQDFSGQKLETDSDINFDAIRFGYFIAPRSH